MRADDASLADMQLAAQRVAHHIASLTKADFLTNRTAQAAVEREISILGEAAGRVSEGLRTAHPEIPWTQLIRLRHFYTHGYERLDAREVWATAKRFVPRVEKLVSAVLPPAEPDTKP